MCVIAYNIALDYIAVRYSAQGDSSKRNKEAAMQEMNQHLAQRLKGLRSELGWSLMWRRGRLVSVRPCWARLSGGVEPDGGHSVEDCHRLSSLFLQLYRAGSHGAGRCALSHRRCHSPATGGRRHAGRSLFPYEGRFGFELFELTLLPGYQRESEPHEPGVTEHVIVISGQMEVLVEGEWRSLTQGRRYVSRPTAPMAIEIRGGPCHLPQSDPLSG